MMKEYYPAYYSRFHCIAGDCRHSCCIGWEIDIDDDTAVYYAALPGPVGERLRANIDFGETASFRLGEGERCPFLNAQNLCDLILSLGEDSLCEICTEHPRFHNDYSDRTESGVGLCCEAAAALILGQKEPFSLLHTGRKPNGAQPPESLTLRDELLRLLTDRRKPLRDRCTAAMARCGTQLPSSSASQWADLFLSLEQLDPEWTAQLRALLARGDGLGLAGYARYAADYETEYENLLCYFIFRHFLNMAEDFSPGQALGFALVSCGMIFLLHALRWEQEGGISFEERAEIARQYSAEIEYSDENPERLLSALAGEA